MNVLLTNFGDLSRRLWDIRIKHMNPFNIDICLND